MFMAMLYRWVFAPGQFLVVYPGTDLATATNETKLKPLISHIPALAPELARPRACRADRFKFSNSVMWFQGAGSQIVAKSCQSVWLDEVDAWPVEFPNNPRDARNRTRSFTNSLVFDVCSPVSVDGKIWQSFLKSSQGYYTLRCKHCGELTMRSCDIHNLQFESYYNEDLRQYLVKKGSARLVCPKCGHQHEESEKAYMIENGDYIHKIPELYEEHAGFQVGSLASQLPSLSWDVIANAQLEASKQSDLAIQMSFDRSFRGLPYRPRKITKDEIAKLKENHKHEKPLQKDEIEMIVCGVDTMDSFFRYAIAALDIHDSVHVLEIGEVEYLDLTPEQRKDLNDQRHAEGKDSIVTLHDILNRKFFDDIDISFTLIDAGGHRQNELSLFVKEHPTAWLQKGAAITSKLFYRTENAYKMFIVNEKSFKTMLIYELYNQKNKQENFLFLDDSIDDKFIEELRDMRPDDTKRFGDQAANWTARTGSDHAFDACKYVYVAREIARTLLHRNKFRKCLAPSLTKRFGTVSNAATEQQNIEQKKSSFFDF